MDSPAEDGRADRAHARPRDRILVTGASGFAGEHLVRALVAGSARGASVAGTYLTRPVAVDGATLVPLDLRDAAATRDAVRRVRPTRVVHCAVLSDVAACERAPDEARAAIEDATANLVAALAAEAPGARLVHVSTDLVFDGEAAPYGDDAAPAPRSVYGACKLAAEALALRHPDAVVLRAALLHGPRATHKGGFLAWTRDALARGDGLDLFVDEFRTPVAVADLARAAAALFDRREGGVYNAGGPDRLSRYAMGLVVARAFGHDEALVRPARLADKTYPAPRPRDVSMDSTRLWSTLGLSPARFEDAVAATAEAERSAR